MSKKKTVKKSTPKTAQKMITNVAIVLDASGSMTAMRKEVIDGFSQQVKELNKTENKKLGYRVSLVTFSTVVNAPELWDRPVEDLRKLTEADYAPDGWTSLLDAIGKTIADMDKLPCNVKKPDNTNVANLLIIITDGMENMSKEFAAPKGYDTIKSMIEERQKKGNWTFTFMGANQDVIATACKRLGMHFGNTAAFMGTAAGYNTAQNRVRSGLSNYSATRGAGGQSVQCFYDPDASAGNKK